MDIKIFKLITMEEVLSEVESEDETHYVLVNPVGIAVVRGKDGQPNVGFAPFPIHAEQKTGATVALSKRNVVYSYEPAEDFKSNYHEALYPILYQEQYKYQTIANEKFQL